MVGVEETASGILDALDRVVLEVEAMDAICNADTEENDDKDFVVSQQALGQAQTCLDEANASDAP